MRARETEPSYVDVEEAVPDSLYASVADRAIGALVTAARRRL